jgi:hypothetical protein
MVPLQSIQSAFTQLYDLYGRSPGDSLIVAGTSSRFGFGLSVLQLTTLSASEVQLSDHEDHQYGAESEVERVELDFDGHGKGLLVERDVLMRNKSREIGRRWSSKSLV